MNWREEYKKSDFLWGKEPWEGLKGAVGYAPKGTALDIGAGEGRNSIFLAKNGFDVLAIDKIPEGLEKLNGIAQKSNLSITTKSTDVREFEFPREEYSLVLSIVALDFLKLAEFKELSEKIKSSLVSGGIICLSVFSLKDPFFKKLKQRKLEVPERNTFYLPSMKTYRHFFTKEEIKTIFGDLNIINLKERRFKDIGHGSPHFHETIEMIAKK